MRRGFVTIAGPAAIVRGWANNHTLQTLSKTWSWSVLLVRPAELSVALMDDGIVISIRTCENWNVGEGSRYEQLADDARVP